MGKAFRDDVTLGAFLQRVIADLRRGVQTFFDIAWFENLFLAVGKACPNAGKAVGLQFQANRERIGVALAGALDCKLPCRIALGSTPKKSAISTSAILPIAPPARPLVTRKPRRSSMF